FNTILLVWLGLTVLLNAERRDATIWLAGVGLLLGGLFFTSHTAILAHGMKNPSMAMDVWWHVGWVPPITAPFAWYMVVLWYTGFWENRGRRQKAEGSKQKPLTAPAHSVLSPQSSVLTMRAHRFWFPLTALLGICTVVLLVVANPLPSYA